MLESILKILLRAGTILVFVGFLFLVKHIYKFEGMVLIALAMIIAQLVIGDLDKEDK